MTFRPTLRPAVWTDNDRNPRPPPQHPLPALDQDISPQLAQPKQPKYRPSAAFARLVENDAMRTGLSLSPVQSLYSPPPLTPSERLWRDRVDFFYHKGYQLRRRYQSEWSPTNENRRSVYGGEDHILQILPQVLDGRRRDDGRVVCIKMIQDAKKIKETQMIQYFSSGKLASDPRNHVVPFCDSFQDAISPNLHFLVMPDLRRFDDPEFTTVSEVVDFITQALEGLVFLHEHNVAHHNLTADQIMMDAWPIIPTGWHFVAKFCQPDGITRIKPLARRSYPVRYYFVGFGSCFHFPPGERPLVSDIGCTDSDVPELSGPVVKPYDPFKLDVYTLGNVFMKSLYMRYHNMNFLITLIDYMRNSDLNARPSADFVLRTWIGMQKRLGNALLNSQTRTKTHEEMTASRPVERPSSRSLTPPAIQNSIIVEDSSDDDDMDIVEQEVEVRGPSSASSTSSGTPSAPPTPAPPVSLPPASVPTTRASTTRSAAAARASTSRQGSAPRASASRTPANRGRPTATANRGPTTRASDTRTSVTRSRTARVPPAPAPPVRRRPSPAPAPVSPVQVTPLTPPPPPVIEEPQPEPPQPPKSPVVSCEPPGEQIVDFNPPGVAIVVPGGRTRRTTHGKGFMTQTLDLSLNTRRLNEVRATPNFKTEHQQTYMQSMTLNMELRESSTIGILVDGPPLDNAVMMHYPGSTQTPLPGFPRMKTGITNMSLGGGPATFHTPLTSGETPPPRFGIASSVGVHPYPMSAFVGSNYYGGTIAATHGPQQQSYFTQAETNQASAAAEQANAESSGSTRSDAINVDDQDEPRWYAAEKEPPPIPLSSLKLVHVSHASRRPQQHSEPSPVGASPSPSGDSSRSGDSSQSRSDKRDIASILND